MVTRLNLIDKEDVVKFISQKDIRLLNLCHVPDDGCLKTLSFAVSDVKKVEEVLEYGERVDGSSLFSCIDPNRSDIYLSPKLETAFVNPFSSTPTLNILCRYLDEDGKPLAVAPETVLRRAEERLRLSTDIVMMALAELEFYVVSKQASELLFPSVADRHYHESEPFSMFEDLRNEILTALSSVGIGTKYGHGEVGRFLGRDGTLMEQHEIEFTPMTFIETADMLAVAKWVVRNVCRKHGVSVSFSPKVALEHPGNGMHIHLCGLKNGRNVVSKYAEDLSVETKEMIGGILKLASSLSAFGNTAPVSYLRFLARSESPMSICWGASNRLALIRVPLWWDFKKMEDEAGSARRTFEFRAPDPFANAYLLLAGIAVAVEHGLKNHEESLRVAEQLHVERATKKMRRLKRLPKSCAEAATWLKRDGKYYEADHIFPRVVVEETVRKLRSYKDSDLAAKVKEEPLKVEKLMQSFLFCG